MENKMDSLEEMRNIQKEELPPDVIVTGEGEVVGEVAEALASTQIAGDVTDEELVTMSKDDLNRLLTAVRTEFDGKLAVATDHIEELKITLEKKSAERHIEQRGQFNNIKLTPRMLGVRDHMGDLIHLNNPDGNRFQGRKLRYVNNHSDMRSLRRAQGYEPVLDGAGHEVRYMDMVLMDMPEQRFEEEIAKPREIRRQLNAGKAAVENEFRAFAEARGVKVDGEITYDREETS